MKAVLFDMKKCSGCRACEKSCTVHAITMQKNEEGFLYPIIDETKCVDCGKCTKVCPVENTKGMKPLAVYAAVHNVQKILMDSSSGGMFTAVSQPILDADGTVFGCMMDSEFSVVHQAATDADTFARMRGSKYVQSNAMNTYLEVKNLLKIGRQVLYTGTPCQIAGLKSYLGKEYTNLLTVDLVCHGVPSPELFKQHIKWLESRCHGKLDSYSFRSKIKAKGQDNLYYYFYYYENFKKSKHGPASLDPYFNAFRKRKTYRESCYQCQFACGERCGDLTIGDYWKVERFHPELKGIPGVSILCINSEKGMEAFKGFKGNLRLVKSDMKEVQKVCTNMREPSSRPSERDEVYKYIAEHGYEVWANDYLKSKRYKLMRVFEALPAFIRISLKRTVIRMAK